MSVEESSFFHFHTHSHHSTLDGTTKVPDIVEKAAKMGHKAIGFLDHGNMSATVKGYKTARANGMKFLPGFEGYLIDPAIPDWENPPKGVKVGRFHFGIQALDLEGYQALVKLTSLSHTRPRFNRFPRLTLGDLAEFGKTYGEHVALYTGCYFGYVQQMLTREGIEKGYPVAKRIVEQYSNWFPNLFVEVQHHNIDHYDDESGRYISNDGDIVEALMRIADELDLPVVAGQDSHYTDQTQKPAHELMKRMVYSGVDDAFPGDSFHLASTEWVAEHYSEEQWARIEEGHALLYDLADVEIPPLDNFKPDVPKISKAPKKTLQALCDAKLAEYIAEQGITSKARQKAYSERMAEEMSVINHLNMAEYHLIVRDYVEWCLANDVFVEARGSANGSLVCFVLGITQIDPLVWGTDFDRYLSVDRIKPPDIDMDVDDSRRPDLMHYLLSKYDSVQIGTFGRLGVTYDEKTDEERGSVLQTWLTSKRVATKKYAAEYLEAKADKAGDRSPTQGQIEAYSRAVFQNKYGHIEDVRDVEQAEPKEYKALRQIAEMNSIYKSYGVHAGGVLLSGENVKIGDYIPTMLVASSNTRVSQYDMDDVEEFGLLKMDILGQVSLRTMKEVNVLLGADDPTDFTWIPDNDPEALKIMRSGKTGTGVFHQEGWTKAKGGKTLPIRSTKDCVLWQALYMPGAMNTGQTAHVERARKDPDYRASVTYIHPIFEKNLKETYGAYVYQNQVMHILKDLGLDIPSINKFLKVVKASGRGAAEKNAKVLAGLAATYRTLCEAEGISDHDINESWGALCGFGAYGFNKNHAAGYGIRSYRCAYMKAHYPLEYMTATLVSWAGRDKEKDYITECRRLGIRILSPHVNISTETWTMDEPRNGIRRGLVSIPGVGEKTALAIADEAPYTSVDDMVTRLPGRALTGGKKFIETEGREATGAIAKLLESNALVGLPIMEEVKQGTLFDPDEEE